MTRFGHYVTVHELRRTGLTVVYSGNDGKSPDDNFAIKVLEPSVLFTDKEREKARANQFLNSARLQQKVVACSSQHWAPIHKYGSSPNGTFYVTDKYDRSLQELIDGHVAPSQKILHVIIRSIAESLIELKKAYKRPHGNLKATNVLITGDFSEMKVALSDPLPDESIDAKVHWYADLRAIGELIYQLVVRRPAPSLDGARIYDSKEWARLKGQAKYWRELCGRLLAVRIRPEAITLESLVEELTELEKSKPVLSRRRLAALGFLLFIAIAVAIYVFFRPPITPKHWEVLCDEYLKWVQPLHISLNITKSENIYNENIKLQDWIDSDPNLEEIIGIALDFTDSRIWKAGFPARFADAKGITSIEEIKNRYDLVKEKDNNLTEAKRALDAVNEIRSFFDPNTAGDPNWPILNDIHKTAISLEKKEEDWLKPAATYLNHLVAKVRPPSEEIFEGVNEILAIKNNKDLDLLNSLQKNITGYKNRWPEIYNDLLSDTVQYIHIEPSSETFRNWFAQATDYREIPDEEDPRNSEEWSVTIENTENVIESILTYKPDSIDEYVKDLRGFKEKVAKLSKIPRIVKNKDIIKQNVEQLNKTYSNLKAQIHDIWNTFVFDELQQGLNACYLLNKKLPQTNETILSLWAQWNRLKDTNGNAPKDLVDRINRLEQVEQSNDQQELVQKALVTSFQSEAAYAAWTRLVELRDSSWPNDYNDLTQDRDIRDLLKIKFKEIELEKERREYLLIDLAGTGLTYEIRFIKRNSSGDEVLSDLVKFATTVNNVDSLEKCQNVESLAKDVAVFLAGEDWQNGKKFDMTTFSRESDLYKSDTTATIKTFRQWLEEVGDYKILEKDPRKNSQYSWDDKISKVEKDIKGEFELNPEGDYQKELKKLSEDFNNVRTSIEHMNKLPLVEKYKNDIYKCGENWKELVKIERKLRPSYCRRLYHDRETLQLIFAEGITLRENFEPVIDASGNPAEVSAWDQIRQAVNNKQEKWTDFFHTTLISDSNNVGWPKYIRSTKDHSVILRFIPAGNGNPEPFYMAIHEITNAQYKRFITITGAKPGRERYEDLSGQRLLEWDIILPYPLYWDKHNEQLKEHPVTYVTHHGAQSYAIWLASQLPADKQHEYAFRAANTLLWSNQSQILTFAHVRARPWQAAAEQYNNAGEFYTLPEPLGAKPSDKDYKGEKKDKIDINRVVIKANPPYPEHSAWPIASRTKQNNWGLYDMIGNVWEWCQDESICGGSCLAPPEYIPGCEGYSSDNYSIEFSDQLLSTCDIGFRVIVPIQ